MRCSGGSPRQTRRLEVHRESAAASRARRWSGTGERGKLCSGSMRSGGRGAGRAAAAVLAVVVLGGCYGSMMAPGYRSLHVVEGEKVSSPPPSPSAYEAYLRARLAFEHEPPKLEEARFYIQEAIRFDPRDPHLWATRAQIEERAGEKAEAAAAARRALVIRPGYPLAEEVLARVEGAEGETSGATASAPAVGRQP